MRDACCRTFRAGEVCYSTVATAHVPRTHWPWEGARRSGSVAIRSASRCTATSMTRLKPLAKSALLGLYKYSGASRLVEALQHGAGRPFVTILVFHRVTD